MLPMTPAKESRTKLKGWLFVTAQVVLLVLMVFGPRDGWYTPTGWMRSLGLGLMVAGTIVGVSSSVFLRRGLTPTPVPNGATDLVTRGPYRYVRHPIYVAVMLFMIGVALRSGSLLVWVALVLLIILFTVKARWEEARLMETFRGYSVYAERTGRFLPRLGI
jgi:protein-S-isoprenylcysteine O-methyltransferase Ste14